jgi:hypothetical protein
MREKKINDNQELLRLREEGLKLKDIARWYWEEKGIRVSPQALCKRLKRLAPPPHMPYFNSLTQKEKKFCVMKVQGETSTQSALKSFECGSMDSAKNIGSQLMRKPEIEMSINELLDYVGLDKTYRLRRLKQIIDCSDLGLAHEGLKTSFKLDGSFIERNLNLNLNADVRPEEEESLRELARALARQKIIDVHKEEVSEQGISDNGEKVPGDVIEVPASDSLESNKEVEGDGDGAS